MRPSSRVNVADFIMNRTINPDLENSIEHSADMSKMFLSPR